MRIPFFFLSFFFSRDAPAAYFLFSPPPLFFLQFQFPYLQIEDGDVGFPILEHCCVRIKQATAPKCMKCETFKEHFPPPTPFKSNIYSL